MDVLAAWGAMQPTAEPAPLAAILRLSDHCGADSVIHGTHRRARSQENGTLTGGEHRVSHPSHTDLGPGCLGYPVHLSRPHTTETSASADETAGEALPVGGTLGPQPRTGR